MSYIVLARKWRPQIFADVIGQSRITRTLAKAIESNRIGQAYLLTGPRGIGKTSTARIFAKALNCHKGLSPNPCNKCPSCKEIAEGRSIDVLEIDGASNRGIGEIRELRSNVKFAPARDRFKIYIIDEVHMLTGEAFNALLKTLEEPPEHVKFIFATTLPYKIPLTILSRCQRFDFKKIPIAEIMKCLKKILLAEKVKAGDDALFSIAKSASGSMRDAESVLDQLISFSEGEIKTEDVDNLLGMVDHETFMELGKTVIEKDTITALKIIDRIINDGKDMEQFLKLWQQHWRDVLMLKMGSTELVELPAQSQEDLAGQANLITENEIFRIIEILSSTGQLIKRNSFSRIPVEIAVAEITQAVDNKADEEKPAVEKNPPVSENPVNIDSGKTDPASENSASLDNITAKWDAVIQTVKKEKLTTSAFLMEGKPVKVGSGKLTVGFEEDFSFHKESCERKESKKLIEKVLHDTYNEKLRLECVINPPNSENKKHEDKHLKKKDELTEEVLTNPIVKKTIELFGVKIIDVREKEEVNTE